MKQNILLILICSLAFVACGGGGGNTPYSGSEYLNVKDIDIPGGNTTATLTIQASDNCEWTITWSDSWIRSITPSKDRGTKNVSVTVDINPSSTQSRTATIIVKNANGSITRSVTIKQLANSEQLSVSPTSINFTTEGGSQEVTVTGNTHWTITGKANWLKLSREEGDNNGSVTVTAEPNTTSSPRDAVLTFTGNNGLSQPLKVTQEAYETEFYVTTPANLTAGAPASSVSIGIAGNANWVVSSNKEWAMPDVTSGQGERTIEVKLTDNTDKEPRKAEITITATGKTPVIVSIEQAAATLPEVGTLALVEGSIGKYEASLSFSVTSVFPITACGLCYSETEKMPTTADILMPVEESTDAIKITGLSSGGTYYVRAYATSAIGTAYSPNVVTVTTPGGDPDRDDNPLPNPL